nr:MarR family transcriptional regulator [Simiduia aestuariiviva]
MDQQLCFKLYAASRLMVKAYRPLLDDMGITYPQYLVLMVLWESESALTVGDLGERLILDSGTLTPLLKRMELNGLLRRQRSDEDERQVRVSVTKAGKALQVKAIDWVKRSSSQLHSEDLDVAALQTQLKGLLKMLG